MTYWDNPWADAVPVSLEDLAECDAMLGQSCGYPDGTSRIMTKELILQHWRECGERLDAYILPQPSGRHSIGVRYGNEPSQYLSPMANQNRTAELLKKRSG